MNSAASTAIDETSDNESTTTLTRPKVGSDVASEGAQISRFGFTFDHELYASRVYKRTIPITSRHSLTSSAAASVE